MNSASSNPAGLSPDPILLYPIGSESPLRPLHVVAIGGGTGLSTLLRGLRRHVSVPGQPSAEQAQIADLAAVVTVTDDGGSSGRLRRDFNMLPPGDLRNCMVALSEEEDVLVQLFAHRFRGGNGLNGHSFGNLFVAALTEITGDFAHAIQLASRILATRGSIYPATTATPTDTAGVTGAASSGSATGASSSSSSTSTPKKNGAHTTFGVSAAGVLAAIGAAIGLL